MHDFTDFPSAKFHEIWTQHVDRCPDENFQNVFWTVSYKGSFFQKNAKISIFFIVLRPGRHNFAMTIDRRKFITKWSLCGMSSFHFYRWNQFKLIPFCTLCTRKLTPKIYCDIERYKMLSRSNLVQLCQQLLPTNIKVGKIGHSVK